MKNKENDLDGDGDDNDDEDDDKNDDDGGGDKDDGGNDDENEDLCKGRNQPWWPPSMASPLPRRSDVSPCSSLAS